MSFDDWQKLQWGDIATLEYGKSLKDYREARGNIPVYGTNGPIGFTDKPLCPFPSVIVGRKGAYRGIHFSKGPFFVIDTAFYLKPKVKGLDIIYAYYQLLTQNINEMDSGSAIPSTSREDFYNLELLLPPLFVQCRIASILSSLDDKIELNRQTNQTLEAIAQAIFKEWFVDFNFPGATGKMQDSELGEIPKGWKVGEVGNLFELQRGFDLPSTKRSNGSIPVIAASGINGYHYEFKVKAPGVTTGRSGILGNVFYIQEDFWPLNTSLFIKKIHVATPLYSYFLLKGIDLKGMNGGSAVPTLNRNEVHKIKTIIPKQSLIEKFEEIAIPLFQKIKSNEGEIQTLTQLRDTLLPKLMKGEIPIPES